MATPETLDLFNFDSPADKDKAAATLEQGGIVLAGGNSVDAPLKVREDAWKLLAEHLDLEMLHSISNIIALDDAFALVQRNPQLAHELTKNLSQSEQEYLREHHRHKHWHSLPGTIRRRYLDPAPCATTYAWASTSRQDK